MRKEKTRCSWVNLKNEKYIKYHDEEWGKPTKEENTLIKMLFLESFQAGLSWECILNKREELEKAFASFQLDQIIHYQEDKIEQLMNNKKIIRNKLKIKAVINNAKIIKEIQKEYGSFSNYIWGFTKNKMIYELEKTTSELSDTIASDMKKRGMKFTGSTIIYSYLQSIGIINSHEKNCYLYQSRRK